MSESQAAARQNARKHATMLRMAGSPVEEREKDDFYETNASAIDALIRAERFAGPIWEPACGRGAISRPLQAAGYEVISTDLIDRGFGEPRVDFLMEYRLLAPNVVTNPPFKLGADFARKALELGCEKLALLMKITFLESAGRADLFDDQPFARCLVFRERQTFMKGGIEEVKMNGFGGLICFAWFIWDRGYTGKPTLGWL